MESIIKNIIKMYAEFPAMLTSVDRALTLLLLP